MKSKNIKLFGVAIIASLAFTSCSDQFLQDKKNYDQASEDVYNYLSGATGRVNDIYWFCLPDVMVVLVGNILVLVPLMI